MRRLTRAVCVVALGIGTAGCMATGNENAMTLGTLGAVAGGIGGTHVGQGKGTLAAIYKYYCFASSDCRATHLLNSKVIQDT